jgi:hydrogenase nickel incorporation protein HypA/HybF
MHELAIAADIISIVEDSASKACAGKVTLIELEIGQLSGIELDALNMAVEVSLKGTIAEDAELKIDIIEGEVHCLDCEKNSPVSDLFSLCPSCGSIRLEITKGKEMRVKSIIVD